MNGPGSLQSGLIHAKQDEHSLSIASRTSSSCLLTATPVNDAYQVELQQTLLQGHKGQQASVEEKQKQQASIQSETKWHGAVLQRRKEALFMEQFPVYFHLFKTSSHYIRSVLLEWGCTSSFVAPRWSVYRFAAFLHDPGVHRGPDSDLLPVVASDQVWHLHTDKRGSQVKPWGMKVRSKWNQTNRSNNAVPDTNCRETDKSSQYLWEQPVRACCLFYVKCVSKLVLLLGGFDTATCHL